MARLQQTSDVLIKPRIERDRQPEHVDLTNADIFSIGVADTTVSHLSFNDATFVFTGEATAFAWITPDNPFKLGEVTRDQLILSLSNEVYDLRQRIKLLESPIEVVSRDEETQFLRKIQPQEATELIQGFVDEHPGARTSDIIHQLSLDPELVVQTLETLKKDGRIGGKPVGEDVS